MKTKYRNSPIKISVLLSFIACSLMSSKVSACDLSATEVDRRIKEAYRLGLADCKDPGGRGKVPGTTPGPAGPGGSGKGLDEEILDVRIREILKDHRLKTDIRESGLPENTEHLSEDALPAGAGGAESLRTSPATAAPGTDLKKSGETSAKLQRSKSKPDQ